MARKGENIYKRKDGRYEARYIVGRRENGKARYMELKPAVSNGSRCHPSQEAHRETARQIADELFKMFPELPH